MPPPTLLLLVLACGIFASLFCGKITALIDTGPETADVYLHPDYGSTSRHGVGWEKPSNTSSSYTAKEDLIWFIQVSNSESVIFIKFEVKYAGCLLCPYPTRIPRIPE